MADYTTSINTANGGRVKYYVSSGGYISINVISAGMPIILAVGQGNSFNVSAAINQAIGDIDYRISVTNNDIITIQNQIANLNILLGNPNLSPELRTQYQNDIAEAQKEITQLQKSLVTAQQAQAQLASSGAATLQSLVDQAKAANSAAQTAKPTPATNSTTTTTTNGPTTTTQTTTTTVTANARTTTTTITSSKTTSSAKTLTGAASDDSGAGQPKPAGSTPGPVKSPAAASGSGGTTPSTAKSTASSGSTQTGVAKSGTNTPANSGTSSAAPTNASSGAYKFESSIISKQKVATASQPGKRLKNPLGEFSSYTYQITLYMMTPDAYEAFIASGRKKINVLSDVAGATAKGGAFVIAQSGGINKGTAKRAPGFEYDYGIDNLSIKHMMTGKTTGSATTISEMSFNISEPYGFSFLTNLRRAGDAIAEYSKGLKGDINPSRQFFVLGIRFLGYDASGRPMLPNTKMASGSGVVDPLSQDGSLFEHFYDISIVSIKFKIDGRLVTYQCKAVSAGPGKGFSTTRGFIQKDKTVEADTVGIAIDKLITQLNKEQEDLGKGNKPSLKYPNKYEIIWLPGTEEIINASIISPARDEKSRLPGSGAKTSEQSNDATATKQQQVNTNAKTMTFSPQPIVQAINQVIMQSSYLEDALSTIYTSNPEADPKTKAQPSQKPKYQKQKLSWYNCHPQITQIKWDDLTKDWSYKISYLIQKYETPVVDSPMVQAGKAYPGPHKRYDYWYTGENSEIIQYEQMMDNAYFNTVVSAGDTATANNENKTGGADSQTPRQPNMQTNQPRQGGTGMALEAQNSYVTSLYDPGAYATAKITIMGDPDFLSEDPSYSEEQLYDKVYGPNGFSINANGGQVFVEVDFKEAVDYTSSGGLNPDGKTYQQPGTLKINDSILFWKYPGTVSPKIKGVSYFVTSCTSTFSNGMFKQVLDCNINDFGDTSELENAKKAAEEFNQRGDKAAQEQATAAGDKTGTTPGDDQNTSAQTTGTPTDKPVDTKNNVQQTANTAPTTQTPAQPTTQTKTGPVATDDGKKT